MTTPEDLRIRVVKCMEPTDLNYGGYDMFGFDSEGRPFCFAELYDYDRVLAALNNDRSKWPSLPARVRRSYTTMRLAIERRYFLRDAAT